MIYIVSLYYLPVSNPPANRMGHLVRTLGSKYGYDNVRVVTGRPNYPHGKLLPEHKWKIFTRATGRFGETIDHIYEFPAAFKGLYLKTFGQLSFALSVFFYFLLRRIKKDDVVLITSGPVFPIYSILFLSYLKRGFRYVVDVRDLWPQVVAGMGFMKESSAAYRTLLKLAESSYRRADALVGNSQGICEYLTEVSPGSEVSLVFNPVDMDLFVPMNKNSRDDFRKEHADAFPDDDRPVFLFSGTFSSYIGLHILFEALVKLKSVTEKFRFIMIGQGEGETGLRHFVESNEMDDQVKILPFMERPELVSYIGAADFCFASLRESPMLRYAIPTKIIEYLACDKKVVAVVSGPFAEMLRNAGSAYVCSPGDAEALTNMLQSLIEKRPDSGDGQGSRAFIDENFGLKSFEKNFRDFFAGILDPKNGSRIMDYH